MADTPDYVGPDQYVKVVGEDSEGNKIYEAGEKSQKFDAGERVPNSYAKSVLGSVNFRNRVKGLVSNPSEDTPDNYNEAQEIVSEFNRLNDQFTDSLSDVKYIGEKRSQNLKNAGVNFEDLQEMTIDEISEIEGIGRDQAVEIRNQLDNAGRENEEIEREIDDLRASLGS